MMAKWYSGTLGPKVSWHLYWKFCISDGHIDDNFSLKNYLPDICLTGEENPRKTSPRKPVPTGDRTRALYVTGAHLPTVPQRRTTRLTFGRSLVQIPWRANMVEVFSGFLNLKIAKELVIFLRQMSGWSPYSTIIDTIKCLLFSLQAEKHRLQFWRSQVFHRNLRNQGCSFTRD